MLTSCDCLHDERSPVKKRAFALATCMQCSRGLCRRLLLIRAETAPSLAMPNQVYTNSAQFGMKTHTTSPRFSPMCSCITRATRFELSAIWKKCNFVKLIMERKTPCNRRPIIRLTQRIMLGVSLRDPIIIVTRAMKLTRDLLIKYRANRCTKKAVIRWIHLHWIWDWPDDGARLTSIVLKWEK